MSDNDMIRIFDRKRIRAAVAYDNAVVGPVHKLIIFVDGKRADTDRIGRLSVSIMGKGTAVVRAEDSAERVVAGKDGNALCVCGMNLCGCEHDEKQCESGCGEKTELFEGSKTISVKIHKHPPECGAADEKRYAAGPCRTPVIVVDDYFYYTAWSGFCHFLS